MSAHTGAVGTTAAELLITGGLGLIGSRLAELFEGRSMLVDDGRGAVVAVDDMRCMLRPVLSDVRVELLAEWAPRVAAGMKAIVHCASPVGPLGILEGGVLTPMLAAMHGALKLSATSQVPLVLLSSSEVYGSETPGETLAVPNAPWSPRWEYAAGKIACELLVQRHHAETGIPVAIVRPWNVTGPRQDASKGFVLPRWVDAALAGEPIVVYGDGEQRRAIMHVDDFAAGIVELLEGDVASWAWEGRPLDFAAPHNGVSLNALAVLTADVCEQLDSGRVAIVHRDPAELHGAMFREAGSGTKLPPARPWWEGHRDLRDIIESIASARRAKLAP